MGPTQPSIRIIAAGPAHREFVRALSGRAFARFGDYDRMLPGLMDLPWILTSIAEVGGRAAGFAMISLEDLAHGEVDLVAIAVEPDAQSGGVGRHLLSHVEAETSRLVLSPTAKVRLTVAVDNDRALNLFRRAGYSGDDREPGTYPRGQVSIELRKTVRS